MFEKLTESGFQVVALHHAEAILTHDMADAVTELQAVLSGARIPTEELIRGGGGEGEFTQRLRRALSDDHGWRKHNFEIKKIVDGEEKESISREIVNVLGFMNRRNDLHPYLFDQSVHTGVVIGCFDDFCTTLTKKTVVAVDNASVHRSEEFEARLPYWKKQGLIVKGCRPETDACHLESSRFPQGFLS